MRQIATFFSVILTKKLRLNKIVHLRTELTKVLLCEGYLGPLGWLLEVFSSLLLVTASVVGVGMSAAIDCSFLHTIFEYF